MNLAIAINGEIDFSYLISLVIIEILIFERNGLWVNTNGDFLTLIMKVN